MPKWQRFYLLSCAGVVGFAIGYMLCDFAGLPRLMYLPLERTWMWLDAPIGTTTMAYLGTFLWGMVAALLAIAVAAVAIVIRPVELTDTWLRLWGGWAAVAVLICGSYYTWNLWPF